MDLKADMKILWHSGIPAWQRGPYIPMLSYRCACGGCTTCSCDGCARNLFCRHNINSGSYCNFCRQP